MGNSGSGDKHSIVVPIVVALIGALGSILAALISTGNMPAILSFGTSVQTSTTTPQDETPELEPTPEFEEPTPEDPPAEEEPTNTGETSITGEWAGSAGDLQIMVTEVALLERTEGGKLLRFYVSVVNDTADAITIPLFGNFVAIDENGQSYEADPFSWNAQFPPGVAREEVIDLEDLVPEDVTTMTLSFSHIHGSLALIDESIVIEYVEIP